jgi:hypothetical protein
MSRTGEPKHLTDLRAAFPGVWVREDGAFRSEDFGVDWAPGDVESTSSSPAEHPYGGPVRFVPIEKFRGRPLPELKLSQLVALTNYVTQESQRSAE